VLLETLVTQDLLATQVVQETPEAQVAVEEEALAGMLVDITHRARYQSSDLTSLTLEV
tara:strand:+ start:256 stop:429 length:174 start_codon:yes stop_codon:yes gene_type:complete